MNNTSDLYLKHFGIKGMHWGIRRFEDKSGRLTSAGKKRYDVAEDNPMSLKRRLKSVKTNNTKRKKILTKLGKKAVTAALVAETGYILYKTGAGKKMIEKGKETYNKIKDKQNYDPELEVMKQASKRSEDRANRIKTVSESTTKSPSKATIAISKANQKFTDLKKMKEARESKKTSTTKKVASALYSNGLKAIKQVGSKASSKIKETAKSKLKEGIDYDDPTTWLKPVSNARDLADTSKRYLKAIKAVQDKDALTAASSLTPELVDATNKLIDQSRSLSAKFRRKNKLE